MTHNIRCETATGPICKCKCHGEFHGIIAEELKKNERFMNKTMGGEVEEVIQKLYRKKLTWPCGLDVRILVFVGRLDSNGIADKNGDRWLIYIRCRYLVKGSCIRLKKSLADEEECKPVVIVPEPSGISPIDRVSPTELKIICFLLA